LGRDILRRIAAAMISAGRSKWQSRSEDGIRSRSLLLHYTTLCAVNTRLHLVNPNLQVLATLIEFLISNAVGYRPTKHRDGNNKHQYAIRYLVVFLVGVHCTDLSLQIMHERFCLIHLRLDSIHLALLAAAYVQGIKFFVQKIILRSDNYDPKACKQPEPRLGDDHFSSRSTLR
jgi:hypothetical protein